MLALIDRTDIVVAIPTVADVLATAEAQRELVATREAVAADAEVQIAAVRAHADEQVTKARAALERARAEASRRPGLLFTLIHRSAYKWVF